MSRGDARAARRNCSSAGWQTGATAKITGLPDSPGSISWSPDGRWIAYTMTVPGEGQRLGQRAAQARRRELGPAARDHRPRQLPQRRRRLREAGLRPCLRGVGRRRRAAAADLRQFRRRRPDQLGAATAARSCSAPIATRIPSAASIPNVYRSMCASGALTALTSRNGPDAAPLVSPDGSQVAWLGYDDDRRSNQNFRALRRRRECGEPALADRRRSTAVSTTAHWAARQPQPVRQLRRPRREEGRAVSVSTGGSRRSRAGWPAAGSTGLIPAAASRSAAAAPSPTPAATRPTRPTSISAGGG